tara:strand:- start:5680 stop:6390 length:711 start_codon:yes stop_codon:yes gene_type:complete
MGRAFEFRKARKMKRWDAMAKAFTRIGREIAISVKEGGPDPANNARLRNAMANAKGASMPKDRVEAAIKRASEKDAKNFEEVVYEGYGPSGVAVLCETATDNPTRTVANIRVFFNKGGGEMGKMGSLNFIFNRKGQFVFPAGDHDIEELEFELIDAGLEEISLQEDSIEIITDFVDFGSMQKALEEKGIECESAELIRLPTTTVSVDEETQQKVLDMIDKMEEDDDVQNVFHNMEL